MEENRKNNLQSNRIEKLKNGCRLGKYEILDVIGQGGNGVVYLAEDTILGKRWAIKQIPKVTSGDYAKSKKNEMHIVTNTKKQWDEAYFRGSSQKQVEKTYFRENSQKQIEEALVMRELDHPGIPRITEQMEGENYFYIVMDYCKGESLWQLCNRRQATVDEIIDWGIQLCDILNYLHGQSPPIIFRDIKPGNIICDEYSRLKLVDFGIAKTDSCDFDYDYGRKNVPDMAKSEKMFESRKKPEKKSESEMLDAKGTRGFAAPEQYKGKYSIQSDIYNLGATLLWCMKERKGGALQRILKKAMAHEPVKRYQDCYLLKRKLLHLQRKRKKLKLQKMIYLVILVAMIGAGIYGNHTNGWLVSILENMEIQQDEKVQQDLMEKQLKKKMQTENAQAFIEYLISMDTLLQNRYEEEQKRYIENLKNKKECLIHILEKLEGGTVFE